MRRGEESYHVWCLYTDGEEVPVWNYKLLSSFFFSAGVCQESISLQDRGFRAQRTTLLFVRILGGVSFSCVLTSRGIISIMAGGVVMGLVTFPTCMQEQQTLA